MRCGLIAHTDTSLSDYHDYISGCYDCNFAPSGFVKGPGDWAQGSAEVGYIRCRLITRTKFLYLIITITFQDVTIVTLHPVGS